MSEAIADPSASEPEVGLEATPVEAPPVEQVASEPAVPSMFTVKVGGEEQQVSLEEALAGYQRQSDYTRKTQELAAEREQLSHADRLWQQIEANPERTIRAMAEAYELNLFQEAQAEQSDELADPDQSDPRWTQVEQFMEQARLAQLQADIDRQLIDVHQRYGVDFKDDDLLQYAVDHQIGNLEDAFRAFAFEQVTRVAQDRAVEAKKQQLPPVAGGHGVAAGAVSPGVITSTMSVADAVAAAFAAHGEG